MINQCFLQSNTSSVTLTLSNHFLHDCCMMFINNGKSKHKTVLLIAILVYTVVFSFSTIIKHRNFYSYAWDLGVFNQAMYNSVFEDKLFHYTCDSYLNFKENYLAFHFSPILGLIFPLYYLFTWVSTQIGRASCREGV